MNQNLTLAWSLGRFVYFDEHTYTRCVHEKITNEDKHDHKLLSKLENYRARDEWALTSLFVMIISICQHLHQRWQQQLNGTSITSGADHQRSTGADDPPSTTNDQRYRFCRQNRMEWMKLFCNCFIWKRNKCCFILTTVFKIVFSKILKFSYYSFSKQKFLVTWFCRCNLNKI